MLAPYMRFLPIVTFFLVATDALGSCAEYDSDSGEIPLDDAPSVQEVKFKIAAMEPLSEADRLVYEAELLGNNPDIFSNSTIASLRNCEPRESCSPTLMISSTV